MRAWPDEPTGDAQLLKPHGTLAGRLIVDSEQVLRGLDPSWERPVRADVEGKTVVFIGYSGRDLDFRPLWGDILRHARRVLWFDLPNPDEQQRRTQMLRSVAASGRLSFPHQPLATLGGKPNPSWDFVCWCREQSLVDLDSQLVARLHEEPPNLQYPRLHSNIPFARAATQQILGDAQAARRSYLGVLLAGPQRRRAAGELTSLTLNHGGRQVAAALAAAWLLPPVGRAKQVRVIAHRKRTTIMSNLGRHAAVLRATARSSPDDVSSLLVLRAAALRMTGSLDAAADLADPEVPLRTAILVLQQAQNRLQSRHFLHPTDHDTTTIMNDPARPRTVAHPATADLSFGATLDRRSAGPARRRVRDAPARLRLTRRPPGGSINDGGGGMSAIAVIIGINDYKFAPLSSAVRDALTVRDTLVDLDLVPVNDVALLTDPPQPGGQPATQSSINTVLKQLYDKGSRYDRLYLFFAGHGVSGYVDAAHSITQTLLIPSDVADPAANPNLLINFDDFRQRLERAGPAQQLLLFDACRDLAFAAHPVNFPNMGWGPSPNPATGNVAQATLFAVSPGGKALGLVDGMGVMTEHLIDALHGRGVALDWSEADNAHVLTPQSVARYVRARIGEATEGHLQWRQQIMLPELRYIGGPFEPIRILADLPPANLTLVVTIPSL